MARLLAATGDSDLEICGGAKSDGQCKIDPVGSNAVGNAGQGLGLARHGIGRRIERGVTGCRGDLQFIQPAAAAYHQMRGGRAGRPLPARSGGIEGTQTVGDGPKPSRILAG